jgi:hypothetical protein
MFPTRVSGEVGFATVDFFFSCEVYGDISDEVILLQQHIFCYDVSGEVYDESSVSLRRAQSFYFIL